MKVYLHKINITKMLGEETELIGRLPAWRYEKSSAVKVPEERMRSIAAGLLLVKALADMAGVTESEIREAEWKTGVAIDIEGKVKNGTDRKVATNKDRISSVYIGGTNYFFNLSHSGEYVAVAANTEAGIGIDIETKVDKDFKVTKRMFTGEEKKYILSEETDSTELFEEKELIERTILIERNKRFRNIWTKKESFLKCTGEGISVPLNSFTFDMESGKVIPAEGAESSYDMKGRSYYTETFTADDYSLSVTTQTDERFALDIEYIKVLV